MNIPGVTNYSSSPTTNTATKTLGKDEFLNLFVTQLRYQNPLSPMDSSGFTTQLAQFGSLEQLSNLSKQMGNMLLYQNSLQNTLTTSLIGKSVKFSGTDVALKGTATAAFTLDKDASKVTITFKDASGAVVRTIDAGQKKAGAQSYTWDGRDASGMKVADGAYSVTIDAYDSSGNAVGSSVISAGTVTGVTYDNKTTYLVIDGKKRIQLSDVQEITGGGA